MTTQIREISALLLEKICVRFEGELEGFCKEVCCHGEIDLEEYKEKPSIIIEYMLDQIQIENFDDDDRCNCTFPHEIQVVVHQPMDSKPVEKESGFLQYGNSEEIELKLMLAESIRDFVCCCSELKGERKYCRDVDAGLGYQAADPDMKEKGILQSLIVVSYSHDGD